VSGNEKQTVFGVYFLCFATVGPSVIFVSAHGYGDRTTIADLKKKT